LNDLDPEGCTHVGRGHGEEPLSLSGRSEVEHRHQISRRNPAQGTRRAANPDVDDVRSFADHFEFRGQVGELERDAHGPLHDPLARHEQPHQRRQGDREHLQSGVAKD
jgi:hypothetical protein